MEEHTRVAIYARVSTAEQAESGYSIEGQLDVLRKYCKMHNKVVSHEFIDRGVSGKSLDGRFELQKLLRAAEDKAYDEVIVWKINRMARKTRDLLEIVDLLDKNNIAFRSYSENFETETPVGKFVLQMLASVGELERNTIVENVKMGMKQRAREGHFNGGRVLGYKSVKIRKGKHQETRLEVVPKESLIVRKIFHLYLSGRGLKAIANQLNHEGYRTKRGNAFGTSSIRDIITNPMYIGKIRYGRYQAWSEKRRMGKTKNPIIVDGAHEAIISEDVWERAQLLRSKKSNISPRQFDGKYILTGLMRCPECGAAMVAHRTKNRLKDGSTIIRRYYACSNFKSKGSSVCRSNSVRADDAEHTIYQRINEVLNKPKILKDIVKNINQRKKKNVKPLQAELQRIDKALQKITAKREKYLHLYEEDTLDRELLLERMDELTEEADKFHTRKSEIELELGDESSQPLSYKLLQDLFQKLHYILQTASTEQVKALLKILIHQINVKNRKIQSIEFVFDEKVQSHFLDLAPSEQPSEGAFSMSSSTKPFRHRIVLTVP